MRRFSLLLLEEGEVSRLQVLGGLVGQLCLLLLG